MQQKVAILLLTLGDFESNRLQLQCIALLAETTVYISYCLLCFYQYNYVAHLSMFFQYNYVAHLSKHTG